MKPTKPTAPAPVIPEPTADLSLLHPILRAALHEVVMELENGLIPIRIFETFRSPKRQACLHAKGISDDQPWASLHQYGLAVDFALWINGEYSWSLAAAYDPFWEKLREIGEFYGLELGPDADGFSHLQLMGQDIKELQAGIFPGGGDTDWWDNLEEHIESWLGHPPGPVLEQRTITATPNPFPDQPRFPVTS